MDNNIEQSDINEIIKFLKQNKKRIFTQSKKVKEFEFKWGTYSKSSILFYSWNN